MSNQNELTFYGKLEQIINEYSKENDSDTPDFILAEYLSRCLENFNLCINKRESWYGRKEQAIQGGKDEG